MAPGIALNFLANRKQTMYAGCMNNISADPETDGSVRNEPPNGLPEGLTIEYVLLSVTVVSTKESAGQFDDSCAYLVRSGLMEYHGVKVVDARVQYNHTKIEKHLEGCECHWCTLQPEPSHAQ